MSYSLVGNGITYNKEFIMNKTIKRLTSLTLGLLLLGATLASCSGSSKSIKPTCNMTDEEMKNMPGGHSH